MTKQSTPYTFWQSNVISSGAFATQGLTDMTTGTYAVSASATVDNPTHYLTNKKAVFDLVRPIPIMERVDDHEIREKILNLSYYKWKKMGFSKGTLHYMKQNAKSEKPFTLNKHIIERLATIA